MAPVREVSIVLLVLIFPYPEGTSGGESTSKSAPGQTHYAHDELHMRLLRRPDDDRQQVPGRIDETRPELNEGKIPQEREMIFETLDDPFDDTGIVVRIPEKGCRSRSAAQKQAIIPGQTKVRIYQLRIPALHLLATGKQCGKFPIIQWFGDAQKRLRMKNIMSQIGDGSTPACPQR